MNSAVLLAPALRAAFDDADYTVDAVLERIGETGQNALQRNSTVAAELNLGPATDPLATLIRLFILQQPQAAERVEGALPGLIEPLLDAGVLARADDRIRAAIDIRPYGSPDDAASGWIVSDLSPGLDSVAPPMRPDYVLGISPASTQLAQMTIRRPIGSALDLGSGCGVQSVHLAKHARRVVATDLNPRANELAALTFALNELEVDQRLGSLYEPVAGERFDLIVTNPPYVMSPPQPAETRLVYREGEFRADQLVEQIVRGSADHLNPGGVLQVLGNWAIMDADNWTQRLLEWVPEGCSALIMERERLDVFEYIEIWLADAGLVGRPEYADRYREWVAYFDQLGITAVGMGWIQIHNSGDADPQHRVEQWPHAVEQPVGEAFAQWVDSASDARLPADEFWRTPWRLADDVIQETIGQPGAEDPSHVVLRSRRGFLRAVEVDTALGGVLGACDGELSVDRITAAVAHLLEVDEDALRADLEPRLRTLVTEGMLRRAPSLT